jgi:hypothetical protein
MDVHACRLVAHEQVVVFVADHELERLRPQCARCERSIVDGHDRAGGHRVRNRGRAAVDRHGAARDQSADLADRHDDEVRLRVVDEPQR